MLQKLLLLLYFTYILLLLLSVAFFLICFPFYNINFIVHIVLLRVIMYPTVKRMAEMGQAVLRDQGMTDISEIR